MAVEDIRNTATEQYWEELRQRWGALLSYRYIGRRFSFMNSGVVDNTVTLRHDMRNAAGGVLVAPLSIAVKAGAGTRRRGATSSQCPTRSSTPCRSSMTPAT
jgi:hypothetical protein